MYFCSFPFFVLSLRLEQGNCLESFCSRATSYDDGKERMEERYLVLFIMASRTLHGLVLALRFKVGGWVKYV